MVSGKYSALAGAISREQAIANISSNLANISTTGYKRSEMSFESLLRGQKQMEDSKGINYVRVSKSSTDFSPGALRPTDNPLDFALQGEGFFKLQGPDGVLYTRRGDFTIDSNGILKTSSGLSVLDDGNGQITVPDTDTSKIVAGEDGTIYLLDPEGNRSDAGKIGVANISDTTKLKRESETTFSLEEGATETAADNIRVVQGNLELSNINMSAELSRMIDSYRTFETYHKVLTSYAKIGDQQDELGTLS